MKNGLPITTALRTLQDAGDRRAWSEALYLGLIDRTQTEAEPTQSKLEDALLPAQKKAGIPKPLTQHPISTATGRPSRTTAPATRTSKRSATRSSDLPGSR